MKKELSDEQLDTLMRGLLSEAAADEATVNEIADSPAIWWGVQRQINEQKNATLSAWPPVGKMLRWLMIGVPAAVSAGLVISFFVFRPAATPEYGAKPVAQPIETAVVTAPKATNPAGPQVTEEAPTKVIQTTAKAEKHKFVAANFNRRVKPTPVRQEITVQATTKKAAEIKTEFIALSYARDPESGQIVRVRVPSSMMVSLGIVGSVKKPTDMVDAEVLVGDDGLTRAIRFIR